MSTDNNPRYAQFDVMYAVMYWDKCDKAEVVAMTRELAQQYIAGQFSSEFYSIKKIKVLRSLPEPRTLYMISEQLRYRPGDDPEPYIDEYKEFPGLGNGKMVALGEVSSSVTENAPRGWAVSAVSWDLETTKAAFAERWEEARRLRKERRAAFSRFAEGSVVRTSDGVAMVRMIDRDGTPCWNSPSGVIHDAEVDVATLTMLT